MILILILILILITNITNINNITNRYQYYQYHHDQYQHDDDDDDDDDGCGGDDGYCYGYCYGHHYVGIGTGCWLLVIVGHVVTGRLATGILHHAWAFGITQGPPAPVGRSSVRP